MRYVKKMGIRISSIAAVSLVLIAAIAFNNKGEGFAIKNNGVMGTSDTYISICYTYKDQNQKSWAQAGKEAFFVYDLVQKLSHIQIMLPEGWIWINRVAKLRRVLIFYAPLTKSLAPSKQSTLFQRIHIRHYLICTEVMAIWLKSTK